MFVTALDYDTPPYVLANLDKRINSFNDFVSEKEEEALRNTIGQLLYDAFIEGLDDLPATYVPATDYAVDALVVYGNDVWKSLVNPNVGHAPEEGGYWTIEEAGNKWLLLQNGGVYYSTTNKWNGMKDLLKPYIYAEWLQFDYAKNSGITVVVPKGENGNVVSPKRLVCNAWNVFSKKAGNGCSKTNSLYGYLKANSDIYENFSFGDPGRMDIFNL